MAQSPSSRPSIRSCSGSKRKGLVARDRSSFVHVFSATASQADVLGQELNTLVERLGGDSIAPLIMQLIDQKRLSRKEAAANSQAARQVLEMTRDAS